MPAEPAPPSDFQGIYLDTNVLLRGPQWPLPSILLNNLLRLAEMCGISRFIPEPVLKEAEDHWLRGVQEGILGLSGAARQFERAAKPIEFKTALEHPTPEILLEQYRNLVDASVKKYRIARTPFTRRTAEEVFGFATKYFVPFASKGEGKGFQDAVILLSVLDHVASSANDKAIFVTMDGGFDGVNSELFIPGFDAKRCPIITLEKAFEFLSKRYYQETIIKPYQQEQENALKAASAILTEIVEFVQSRLTLDMLRAPLGGRVVKILSLDEVVPIAVETPLPEPKNPDRTVEILLRIAASYKVVVAGGIRAPTKLVSLAALMKGEQLDFAPYSEEREAVAIWRGGIQATANVAGREFKNIELKSLVADDTSLRESTALKARESAKYWMTTRIEDDIIGKTKIPSQTEQPKAEIEDESHA